MKNNIDIRILMMREGVTQYDLAEELGITASWVSRLLRSPLSAENRDKFLRAIERLTGGIINAR